MLLSRRPLGTSLEISQYETWLRQRPLLALLGTPVWTTIQTQPPEELQRQWAALGSPGPTTFSPEQIELMAYTALAAGSRALVFESSSRLDADDFDTRLRAGLWNCSTFNCSSSSPGPRPAT